MSQKDHNIAFITHLIDFRFHDISCVIESEYTIYCVLYCFKKGGDYHITKRTHFVFKYSNSRVIEVYDGMACILYCKLYNVK